MAYPKFVIEQYKYRTINDEWIVYIRNSKYGSYLINKGFDSEKDARLFIETIRDADVEIVYDEGESLI